MSGVSERTGQNWAKKIKTEPDWDIYEKNTNLVAIYDLKRAYQLSLSLQIQYAFTPDVAYFEVYSHVIRLLGSPNSILKKERGETFTEQGYVGEVWTPIMILTCS
ncbi:hypothetical protein EDC94DRAFT_688909 [Helicostylum pulchrum]|nr:hypothetical protein EDC94DRAFT_688909 [Helicostylum pulchrum]